MATIRKHGAKWQVQIRRKDRPVLVQSFTKKVDATRWAREQELLLDQGGSMNPLPDNLAGNVVVPDTLRVLMQRYETTITPKKRSCASELFHLRQIKRHWIADRPIMELTSADISQFRDDRLRTVSGSTVRKELVLIGAILKQAKSEWGYDRLTNPLADVRKPPANRARDRRLDDTELSLLEVAFKGCRNPVVKDVFLFALATGMRRGEVLSLEWRYVDLNSSTAYLPVTKNGEARRVPLSPAAKQILLQRKHASVRPSNGFLDPIDKTDVGQLTKGSAESNQGGQDKVFPITANAFKLAWRRVRQRAGVVDLRLHDMRHEAISRFFEMGLSVPEVALISGHKDPRMLFRYTHLRAEDLAKKIFSMTS